MIRCEATSRIIWWKFILKIYLDYKRRDGSTNFEFFYSLIDNIHPPTPLPFGRSPYLKLKAHRLVYLLLLLTPPSQSVRESHHDADDDDDSRYICGTVSLANSENCQDCHQVSPPGRNNFLSPNFQANIKYLIISSKISKPISNTLSLAQTGTLLVIMHN